MSRKMYDAVEEGRKGGLLRAQQAGHEGMSAIAKKGRKAMKKKDPDYGKKLSALGIHAREVKKQAEIARQIDENTPTIKRFTNIITGRS